jgi:hypothetical protein
MKRTFIFIIISIIIANFSSLPCTAQKIDSIAELILAEWPMANIAEIMKGLIKVDGKPEVTGCKYGKALSFNGSEDGIFLDSMPLAKLRNFTIEIIFQPQSGGNFEQRYLHFGEVQGNRLLLELRSVKADWYLDAYIKSGANQCTLIDPGKLHLSDKWYHIACVLDKNKLTTYINGKKENEGDIDFTPLITGKTSIGVRQNVTSWFKGSIFKVRITGKALTTEEFMKF